MNDNVAKLIEALRSGRYVQTTGQLRKDNSFCWAGVACNIFDPHNWDGEEYDGNLWVMNKDVQSFYGFSSPIGDFVGDPYSLESLSEMNDGGCDFERIATTIEWGWKNNECSEMFEHVTP
jgi:hypothetical protein